MAITIGDDNGRRIKVTLIAETEQFVAAMGRAKVAISELREELERAGIALDQMPDAIVGVLKLVND